MKPRISRELKRYNYLFGETNAAYHQMYLKVGLLEAEGIICLETSGTKNKMVCLTEAGRSLAERTAGRVIEAENQIFASWTKEDVEKYLELTEAYANALKEKVKNM